MSFFDDFDMVGFVFGEFFEVLYEGVGNGYIGEFGIVVMVSMGL